MTGEMVVPQVPEDALPLGRVYIEAYLHADGSGIGVNVAADGNLGVPETVGLLEMAKFQYINGKSMGEQV